MDRKDTKDRTGKLVRNPGRSKIGHDIGGQDRYEHLETGLQGTNLRVGG